MDVLSQRQLEILSYIVREIRARSFPPTLREIARGVGLRSPSCVLPHLERLEGMGYIRREPRIPRGLVVLREA